MKIAILSNATVEMLARMLGGEHAVWTPPGFGAWVEIALAPPADLISFSPDIVAILLDEKFSNDDARSRIDDAVALLAATFPKAKVVVPDLKAILSDLGDAAYDERMWKLAKMPWSMDALLEIKKLFTPVKKVLALDLDNTLWKGVVSEDGVDAIAPNVLLQRKALMLKECGVVLVALSKNNPEDVAPALRDARMLLHEDDFAAMRINWDAKSLNLSDVARELNVGIDSFVFVDDNPGNRAEMRASLPEVTITPFPPDLSLYFHSAVLTDEDRMRTAHYKAESLRREEASRLSLDDYLRSLDIRNEIHLIREEEFVRVAQLAQKTNQFNVCTNRWTEADIRVFAADSRRAIFTLHSSDRFGDLGLVAFVHVMIDGDAAEIVDWVMSCRAMNRRIEFMMEDEVERALAARGVKKISATWKRTAKNSPVENLFDSFGFELVESTPELRRYKRPLKKSGFFLQPFVGSAC